MRILLSADREASEFAREVYLTRERVLAPKRLTFDDLIAGTYEINQTQPDGFDDGLDQGKSTWTVGNDTMSNIVVEVSYVNRVYLLHFIRGGLCDSWTKAESSLVTNELGSASRVRVLPDRIRLEIPCRTRIVQLPQWRSPVR